MKHVKNILIFVLTSAFLASGLAVSASAQSYPAGTSGEKNCVSWSDVIPGTQSSGCLSGIDLNSILGNLYSSNASNHNQVKADATSGSTSENQAAQTCPDSTAQNADCNTRTQVPAVTNQGSANNSTCAAPASSTAGSTKAPAQAAKAEAATEETVCSNTETSAATADRQPSSCTPSDQQYTCTSDDSQAAGNSLMAYLNGLLKKCGIDLSTLGIKLPGCGTAAVPSQSSGGANETASNGTATASNGKETVPSSSGSNSQSVPPAGQNDTTVAENQNADSLDFEEQVVALVNEQRAANGLNPLTLSTELSNVARTKSQDMHDHHYFAHESPTYGSPFDMLSSFGISYRAAGENIAMGYATPEAVMNAWMNSSGHRANILNASYTQIGVGYVADGNYWTQEFIG